MLLEHLGRPSFLTTLGEGRARKCLLLLIVFGRREPEPLNLGNLGKSIFGLGASLAASDAIGDLLGSNNTR